MKRPIALMLTIAMILLSLGGCGGSGPSGGDSGSYPTPENPVTLKMGYDPPVGEITDLSANEFKRIVEEQTGGAILIELYPSNQLGSMKQMMDGVMSGTIDMTLNPWNMLTTVMPEFNAMILPFNIDTLELYWDVVGGQEFRDRTNELAHEKGIHFLGVPNGVFRGLITTSPVQVPDDLKGLKVRVMDGPIYTDMFGAWGGTTSVISFSECYTALQQGVIDSVDNDPSMGVLMKFFEVAPYYTPTNHIVHGCPMFINLEVWNSLSPEQQEIMNGAAREMEAFSFATYLPIDAEFTQLAQEEMGVTYVEFDAATRQIWRDMSEPVYDKYEEVIGEEFYTWFMDYVDSLR